MSDDTKRRILLVTGCPRSGTTALALLLTHHPKVAVSNERYSKLAAGGVIGPEHFEPDRYREFRDGDCDQRAFDTRVTTWARNKATEVSVLGDKVPNVRAITKSLENFADVRVLVILRSPFSIAQSFQERADQSERQGAQVAGWPANWDYVEAVEQFNQTVADVRRLSDLVERGALRGRARLLVVHYEEIFHEAGDLGHIFEFLGVDPDQYPRHSDPVMAALAKTGPQRSRAAVIEKHVTMNADFDGFRKLVAETAVPAVSGRRDRAGADGRGVF